MPPANARSNWRSCRFVNDLQPWIPLCADDHIPSHYASIRRPRLRSGTIRYGKPPTDEPTGYGLCSNRYAFFNGRSSQICEEPQRRAFPYVLASVESGRLFLHLLPRFDDGGNFPGHAGIDHLVRRSLERQEGDAPQIEHATRAPTRTTADRCNFLEGDRQSPSSTTPRSGRPKSNLGIQQKLMESVVHAISYICGRADAVRSFLLHATALIVDVYHTKSKSAAQSGVTNNLFYQVVIQIQVYRRLISCGKPERTSSTVVIASCAIPRPAWKPVPPAP
jgi:hypothetical protein